MADLARRHARAPRDHRDRKKHARLHLGLLKPRNGALLGIGELLPEAPLRSLSSTISVFCSSLAHFRQYPPDARHALHRLRSGR